MSRLLTAKLSFHETLLVLLWLSFLSLGSLRFAFSNQLPLAAIVVLSTLLIFYRNSGQDIRSVHFERLPFWSIGLLVTSVTAQFLSAYLNEYNFSRDIPVLATTALGVIVFSRFSNDLLIRSFYWAGSTYIFVSWIVELATPAVQNFASGFDFNFLGTRFSGLAAHPNSMGLLCVLLFAVAVLKLNNFYLAAFATSSLVFTEYRGGMIAALAILVIWLLGLRRTDLRLLAIFLLLCFGSIVVFLFGDARGGSGELTTGRVDIWAICQSAISNSQVLGTGPNSIARQYGLDRVDWFRPFHCHNQVLDDSVNFGLILGAFNFGILMFSLFLALRKKQLVLVGLLGSYLIAGLFESPVRLFTAPNSVWMNVAYLTFFFMVCKSGRPAKVPPIHSTRL